MLQRLTVVLCLLANALVVVHSKPHSVPQPLYSGYIPLENKPGSSLFYAYWEAANGTSPDVAQPHATDVDRPILLWLQGGPGCASSFGAFYELGPFVTDAGGKLVPNPYGWNQNFGLLIIDQPIGTGYSIAGSEQDIPVDLQGVAQDLYIGIYQFFDQHSELQQRPFFITGESYAGKYIPSIAHYILQVEDGDVQKRQLQSRYCRRRPDRRRTAASPKEQPVQTASGPSKKADNTSTSRSTSVVKRLLGRFLPGSHHSNQQQQPSTSPCRSPTHVRPLNLTSVPLPNFDLVGVAIGNGLTDPQSQTRALASVVYNMGLVPDAVQRDISERTEDVVQQISQGLWEQATSKRSELLEFIQQKAGVATLLDVRRTEGYDAGKAVDTLLDSAAVRDWMGAAPAETGSYKSCSEVVERVMLADVMRSCLVLVEDILETMPVLLYQGQFDAQDGVAGTNAWIKRLDWEHLDDFEDQEGELWYAEPGVAAGWQRQASTLKQVVIRNAGHMVPRDQPAAALAMMQQWVAGVLGGDEGWGQGEQSTRMQRKPASANRLHRDVRHPAGVSRWRGGVAVSRK